MAVTLMMHESAAILNAFADATEPCTIGEVNAGDEDEVLDFLATRPIHTVFMASLIRDNGLSSSRNRGSFYACRDLQNQLEGVALIGHATLIEARTAASLRAFARLAGHCLNAHLIRGERETINQFWKHYAKGGQELRLVCRELLFEQREPLPLVAKVDDLRPATLSDLDPVLNVNAALAFEESGINPLYIDPSGFRQRTARRIEQNRVWIWEQDGKLMFKADVIADSPQAIYLEGVHVHPDERLKGHGLRCMTQLGHILLAQSNSVCLTINERNRNAAAFYAKAGYQLHSYYETIYLR